MDKGESGTDHGLLSCLGDSWRSSFFAIISVENCGFPIHGFQLSKSCEISQNIPFYQVEQLLEDFFNETERVLSSECAFVFSPTSETEITRAAYSTIKNRWNPIRGRKRGGSSLTFIHLREDGHCLAACRTRRTRTRSPGAS